MRTVHDILDELAAHPDCLAGVVITSDDLPDWFDTDRFNSRRADNLLNNRANRELRVQTGEGIKRAQQHPPHAPRDLTIKGRA